MQGIILRIITLLTASAAAVVEFVNRIDITLLSSIQDAAKKQPNT